MAWPVLVRLRVADDCHLNELWKPDVQLVPAEREPGESSGALRSEQEIALLEQPLKCLAVAPALQV